jgi:hypothetical protein
VNLEIHGADRAGDGEREEHDDQWPRFDSRPAGDRESQRRGYRQVQQGNALRPPSHDAAGEKRADESSERLEVPRHRSFGIM